nr:AraC family transcriptional regulator [uncultured Holophaga sp.]
MNLPDNTVPSLAAPERPVEPGDLAELARLLVAFAPYDGSFDLRVPGLWVVKASRPHKAMVHGIQKASLCLVAQGAKSMFLGPEVIDYSASRMLVTSVDVPVGAQVTVASPEKPFVCLKLELDIQKIAELAPRVFPNGLPQLPAAPSLAICPVEHDIIQAAIRLVGLMGRAQDAELLAPLVVDEILVRLLQSPIGPRVAQLGRAESRMQRVSKAVSWVRTNYAQTLDVERLALLVNMSLSSFHQHFKSVTSMSPLQYQKVLRLQEARRLMLAKAMDAGTASRQVGYLSASQFSREYRRYFGHAPTQDLSRLKETGRPEAIEEN